MSGSTGSSTVTVVLVHGAFAENAGWTGVISRLAQNGVRAFAAANPLRGVAVDSRYVADRLHAVPGPVVLVGHGYGGMVITQAAVAALNVEALVYVGAFAPETEETAADLATLYPGSTLRGNVVATPLSSGESELTIQADAFPQQFCGDLDAATSSRLAATQRAVLGRALDEPLTTAVPAWRTLPSWFVYGAADRLIPAAAHAHFARRAGSQGTTRIEHASHAIALSEPDAVTRSILAAIAG